MGEEKMTEEIVGALNQAIDSARSLRGWLGVLCELGRNHRKAGKYLASLRILYNVSTTILKDLERLEKEVLSSL